MRITKFLLAAVVAIISSVFFTGCTTANYGLKPTAVAEQKDTYKFKVYVGGFAGPETAFNEAKVDIENYQKANGYKAYTILNKEYNVFPSYFEYTVRFDR